MKWYYSKNNSQVGPVDQHELLSRIASGEVSPTDLCWRDGMPDWIPISQVSELRAFPAVPSTPVAGGVSDTPYAAPSAAAAPTFQVPSGPQIPTYLVQSILVTIFCCWPLGIPAIVYAAKVDGLKSRGDIAGAMAASAKAKTWCMVAGGLGALILIIWLAVVIFAAISGQAAGAR